MNYGEVNISSPGGALMTDSSLDSNYDILLRRYKNIKNQLVNVIEDKENLLRHRFFDLKTDYITKIGYLEYELYKLNSRLGIAKRKIELIQANNINKAVRKLPYIEELINIEFKDLLEVLNLRKREVEIASYLNTFEDISFEDFLELKRCFRGLIKLIHPYINPNANQIQKRLWEKGCIAYENGEVVFLKVILKLTKDEVRAVKDLNNYSIKELNSMINDFEQKISATSFEVKEILKNFPFNKEELLMDERKICDIQKELENHIKGAKNVLIIMEDHFLMILDDAKYIN